MHARIGALLGALFLGAIAAGQPSQPSQPGQVVPFCDPAPNSTGLPGLVSYVGSTSASANDFRFRVAQLPQRSLALVAMSYTSTPGYPFGNGNLCLNPWALHRVTHAFLVPRNGILEVDAQLPTPPQTGQWHYFQVIYRDTVGARFNLSSGLAIEFVVP